MIFGIVLTVTAEVGLSLSFALHATFLPSFPPCYREKRAIFSPLASPAVSAAKNAHRSFRVSGRRRKERGRREGLVSQSVSARLWAGRQPQIERSLFQSSFSRAAAAEVTSTEKCAAKSAPSGIEPEIELILHFG